MHWPCHVSPNQHWCHPIHIHTDSYIVYKTLVETSFPNSKGDRSSWVPGEREALETNAQTCRPHDKWASLSWVSVWYSLHVEGLGLLHGESNDICEDETFQELSSWTVVLKSQWMEDLLTRGFLCYVPTLSNPINSQASNYYLQQGISACPCKAVKSPHYPSKNAIEKQDQQPKLEKSFRWLVPKREWHCLTLSELEQIVSKPLQAAPSSPNPSFSSVLPEHPSFHSHLQKKWSWLFGFQDPSFLPRWEAPLAQWAKNPLAVQETQETWVWSLGYEDPLEEGTATHSSIRPWEIQWTEEPCGLQSKGSPRVRHN